MGTKYTSGNCDLLISGQKKFDLNSNINLCLLLRISVERRRFVLTDWRFVFSSLSVAL